MHFSHVDIPHSWIYILLMTAAVLGSVALKGLGKTAGSDKNMNLAVTVQEFESLLNQLNNALENRQDLDTTFQGQRVYFPYVVLADASWRVHKQDTGWFSLKIKTARYVLGQTDVLSFEDGQRLVVAWCDALQRQEDLLCELSGRRVYLSYSLMSKATFRFEYEYEQKTTRADEYELEFHVIP